MPESPERPQPDEYADFYDTYIAAVDGPLLETLEHDAGKWQTLLATVPSAREGHRYAPGKWSIREVVGHVIDGERFEEETWDRRGTASGYEFTVRSLAWIMAGHSRHHRGVLAERYLQT